MTPLDKKIIGQSPAAIQLKKMIALIAPSDAPAIIFGATGSGKELVAEALHEESRRKGRFVTVNCAAIPKELIEAEIFGFEKGALRVPLNHLSASSNKLRKVHSSWTKLEICQPIFKLNYLEF